ncbi:MAG: zinc metallopeptidase [Anaerolineae bacterium]|nr:zinc metallopeptidase [Anaerolineae bacterium]
MFFWDPVYLIFALPALLLAIFAQMRVQGAYQRFLRVPNARGVTGLQAAQALMRASGLHVNIESIPGQLTDHYDPRQKVLRLSRGVASQASVASVAIVAHELGHAQQDAQAFALLRLRSGLVPLVNFSSWLGPILFMLGWLFQAEFLLTVGIWAFGAAVVFALVTLPVELDASRRAMELLDQTGVLVDREELRGARRVLNAAALTYVAALAQSLATLLYYLFRFSGRRRD